MAKDSKRSLSTKFFNRLKFGDLRNLVDILRFKEDSEKKAEEYSEEKPSIIGIYSSRFKLSLRGDSVIVYYKGNVAIAIPDNTKDNNKNTDEDNIIVTHSFYKYIEKQKIFVEYIQNPQKPLIKKIKPITKNDKDKKKVIVVSDKLTVNFKEISSEQWQILLSLIADGIDNYESQDKAELEAEQRMWYENNMTKITNVIDYLIIDTEYVKSGSGAGRADLVALYWPNHRSSPGLALIELKYDIDAVGGGGTKDNSTLIDHWNKFCEYQFTDEDNVDMTKVFWQLYELGMYKKQTAEKTKNGNKKTGTGRTIGENILEKYKPQQYEQDGEYWEKYDKKMIDNKVPVQFVVALANYHLESENLNNQLTKIENSIKRGIKPKIEKTEVLFAISSFMGYGLYKEGMFSLKQIRDIITLFKNKKV